MITAAACILALAGSIRPAWADANQAPIAVPLIGTSGVGSPYPSRITVASRGGSAQSGQPTIILHAVTHPCIEDLAVLLVHNGTDKYLLLSNAGGCRPLQGTDLVFSPTGTPIPDTDPLAPTPYAQTEMVTVSNYGVAPAFPNGAPAGPYLTSFPNTTFEGNWDLYVIDTTTNNRGVIAAGWSLNYPTYTFTADPNVTFPVTIPATSPPAASSYPVTFDLSGVPAGVKVQSVQVNVVLSHNWPDLLHMVLQAPNGATTLLMANAGGDHSNAITNVALTFSDSAGPSLPDNTLITAGSYKPTKYGVVQNPPNPPGGLTQPGGGFGTTLGGLNGQDVRGVWKLWIYNSGVGQTGSLASASLTIATDTTPLLFHIDSPTTSTTYTATTPFVHFEGTIDDSLDNQHTATWYVLNGGQYYASGPMTFTPGSNVVTADIPMKKGTTFVTIYVRDSLGRLATDDVDVTVNEFVYTLSEGATGGFFDLDVTSANPTDLAAPLDIQFLPEHSAPVPYSSNVLANGQTQLHVDDLTPGDAVSTIVHSSNAVPLAVERTMSWDSNGYGGSGGTAIFPNKHWIFAEGSQGYFDTFLLLSNNGTTDANVNVKFLVEGGSPVNYSVAVPASKRVTVYAGDIPAIRNTSFGMDITADQAITAERSMYFPHDGPRIWEGGHETGGVNDVSKHWFLAEGATGPFFECFVLLSNPSSTAAHVSLSYLLPDGSTIPQTVTVPANGRLTLNLEHDVPNSTTPDIRMSNNAISTTINSDVGIIVERSMYWPDISLGWREAHNSIGVTDAGLRWAVSDGRIGGQRNYQTYILLANPNSVPAEVQVRFLKSGAAPVVQTMTLAPTSRTNIAPATDPALSAALGSGVFSVDIQVLNFQPIVVEKALYWDSTGETWAAGTGTVGTPIPPPEE